MSPAVWKYVMHYRGMSPHSMKREGTKGQKEWCYAI